MNNKKVGNFTVVVTKLVPEGRFHFCRPEDAKKIIEDIKRFEKNLKTLEDRET